MADETGKVSGPTTGSRAPQGQGQSKAQGDVRETLRQAEGEARDAVHEVKERVSDAASDVKAEAERKVDRWSTQFGEQIEHIAKALRAASETLEDEGEGRMSALTDNLAEQVQRMGGHLRNEDPQSLMRELEQTARSNPAAFVGTTFVAGVLMGRFLRASAPEGAGAGSYGQSGPGGSGPGSRAGSTAGMHGQVTNRNAGGTNRGEEWEARRPEGSTGVWWEDQS